jgi:hypothetical protein
MIQRSIQKTVEDKTSDGIQFNIRVISRGDILENLFQYEGEQLK